MAVDEHGTEVIRRAGEEITPGDPTDMLIKVGIAVKGTKVHNYDEVVALPKDSTDNHDRIIADGDTFRLTKVLCGASGIGDFELFLGDGAAVEVFSTIAKTYSDDDAQTNPDIDFGGIDLDVVGTPDGRTIRVARTNRENQALDMNTTLIGADV